MQPNSQGLLRGYPGAAEAIRSPGVPDSVDLNADLGEEVTDDAALLAARDQRERRLRLPRRHPGDHARACAPRRPGWASRWGRRSPTPTGRTSAGWPATCPPDLLTEQVADQVGTLTAIAVEEGVAVSYLKAHGALYHRVREDAEQAAAVLAGSGHLPVLGQHGVLLDLATGAGRATYVEGFADRAYRGDTAGAARRAGGADRGRRGDRRAGRRPGAAGPTRSACTATARTPSRPREPYDGRSPKQMSSWWRRGDRRVGARGAGGRASGRRARVHDLHPRAATAAQRRGGAEGRGRPPRGRGGAGDDRRPAGRAHRRAHRRPDHASSPPTTTSSRSACATCRSPRPSVVRAARPSPARRSSPPGPASRSSPPVASAACTAERPRRSTSPLTCPCSPRRRS